jgi:hypothetical protein
MSKQFATENNGQSSISANVPRNRHTDHRIHLWASLALFAEATLWTSVALHHFELVAALGLHLVIVALTLLTVRNAVRRKVDAGSAVLLSVTTFVAGPFGALGTLVACWLSSGSRDDPALLDAWYKRISLSTETDTITRVSDTVAIGRSINLSAALPEKFVSILRSGSISEQQKVLGLIARHFHPDYLAALKLALVNEAPVIRVQAAAVAAHIRQPVLVAAQIALTAAQSASNSIANRMTAIRDARACLESGLIDERDRVQISAELDQVLQTFPKSKVLVPLDGDTLNSIEKDLLHRGSYQEFRDLRLRARRKLFGRYVTRRTPLTSRFSRTQSAALVKRSIRGVG